MPNYDYACQNCGDEVEVFHPMNTNPQIPCQCGMTMSKAFNTCRFSIGDTIESKKKSEVSDKEGDMKQELREDHGVENIIPRAGLTISDVHSDVKMQGSLVKDKMDLENERSTARIKAKDKEWRKGAERRAPAKSRAVEEKRKKEKQAKEKIVI